MKIQDPLARLPIPDSLLRGLALTMLALALPHLGNLGWSIFGFFLFSILWRLLAVGREQWLPGRVLLGLFTLAGLLLAVTGVPPGDGQLAGSALLLLMLGLKLLEIRTRRDVHLALLLGQFLIFTQFLFRQELWLALYLLALASLLLAFQIGLTHLHFDLRQSLRSAQAQFLLALPLATLLFVFFPRLDSPLWRVHNSTGQAISGISDEMRLGSIGELIRSEATAFRVRFPGRVPEPRQRYWRGPVLWHFDGRRWRALPHRHEAAPRIEGEAGTRIDYEITMEPTGKHWVFALDLPWRLPPSLRIDSDLTVRSDQALSKRRLFQLSSLPDHRLPQLGAWQRQAGLQLPDSVSPRVRALARGWRATHPRDDAAVVAEALRHYREQPFVYTLSPGLPRGDPTEHFLFRSRRGFCEHYASSMALLMRLAGIPSRVVVGYQGGQRNPLSDHWLIRQSDAHAWVELWLRGQGWVRVDPTAAVAPERIELGLDADRTLAEGRIAFGSGQLGWLRDVVRQGRWLVDALDQGWYRWVLGFSAQRQRSLMQTLGLDRLGRYATAMAFAIISIAAALMFLFVARLPRRNHRDPAQRLWQRYRRKLRRGGLALPDWYGPRKTLSLAIRRWPERREALQELTDCYERLRYGKAPDASLLRRLRKRLLLLRLPRR